MFLKAKVCKGALGKKKGRAHFRIKFKHNFGVTSNSSLVNFTRQYGYSTDFLDFSHFFAIADTHSALKILTVPPTDCIFSLFLFVLRKSQTYAPISNHVIVRSNGRSHTLFISSLQTNRETRRTVSLMKTLLSGVQRN